MTTIQLCSLVSSRFSAFKSQQGPRSRKAGTCSLIHAWLLFMSFVELFVQLEKRHKKNKQKKNTHPWHSRPSLRRCFLLFTRRFSPRTVGISVLAHPTQNLFAQILLIIPPAPRRPLDRNTSTTEKKRNKTRFALVTLSHAVSSSVGGPLHQWRRPTKRKSSEILDFHTPSRRTAFLAGIVYQPLERPSWMEMHGG